MHKNVFIHYMTTIFNVLDFIITTDGFNKEEKENNAKVFIESLSIQEQACIFYCIVMYEQEKFKMYQPLNFRKVVSFIVGHDLFKNLAQTNESIVLRRMGNPDDRLYIMNELMKEDDTFSDYLLPINHKEGKIPQFNSLD